MEGDYGDAVQAFRSSKVSDSIYGTEIVDIEPEPTDRIMTKSMFGKSKI